MIRTSLVALILLGVGARARAAVAVAPLYLRGDFADCSLLLYPDPPLTFDFLHRAADVLRWIALSHDVITGHPPVPKEVGPAVLLYHAATGYALVPDGGGIWPFGANHARDHVKERLALKPEDMNAYAEELRTIESDVAPGNRVEAAATTFASRILANLESFGRDLVASPSTKDARVTVQRLDQQEETFRLTGPPPELLEEITDVARTQMPVLENPNGRRIVRAYLIFRAKDVIALHRAYLDVMNAALAGRGVVAQGAELNQRRARFADDLQKYIEAVKNAAGLHAQDVRRVGTERVEFRASPTDRPFDVDAFVSSPERFVNRDPDARAALSIRDVDRELFEAARAVGEVQARSRANHVARPDWAQWYASRRGDPVWTLSFLNELARHRDVLFEVLVGLDETARDVARLRDWLERHARVVHEALDDPDRRAALVGPRVHTLNAVLEMLPRLAALFAQVELGIDARARAEEALLGNIRELDLLTAAHLRDRIAGRRGDALSDDLTRALERLAQTPE